MRLVLWGLVFSVAMAAQADPSPIQRMVATERAFAAATLEIGARDGFLIFFAPDSIQMQAGPTGAGTRVIPARPEWAARPLPKLPLGSQLLWAPYTGQVSSDGTLGWLTGAFVSLAVPTKDITAKGAYFSVWARQDDGTWRVWLDEGVSLPDVWQDAAPFRAAPEPDTGIAGNPQETVAQAEAAITAGGVAAWQSRLAADVRLHRDGRMPILGREAATAWARDAWIVVTPTLITTRTATSNDLGVAVGGYNARTATGSEHGTWVRVWKRDTAGHWRIVFESSKAVR